ncbi:DUF6371 domain-containing protein, partial [Crocinitomicaceae bacterium]|nr:DUF6371 domain-containing protein [Crocinitomicaceae bacterium]
MYKYRFDLSSKKYHCPDCGKKRFVRYVDADNNLLSEQFGKCDRETNCGYWLKPERQDVIDLKPIKTQKRLQPSYIVERIVQRSLSHYNLNSFFNYLSTKFDKELVLQTFKKYRVGTSKYWGGSPVFWQTDLEGNVRSGKIVKFVDGDRVKTPFNHVTWSHKLLNLKGFELQQVMFGTHLLNEYEGDIVCIVESEKTAIVMDMYFPGLLWLSIGSLSMLNYERIKMLKVYNVILYPDTDGEGKWKEKAKFISESMGQEINVSELVSNQTILYDKSGGFDLADIVLDKVKVKVKPEESEVKKAIQRLIAKNQS